MPEDFSPEKRRRGMLAFYVSTGVALVLLVAGYFAWTPLRIWYWERTLMNYVQAMPADRPVSFSVRRPDGSRVLIGTAKEGTNTLEKLLEVGPAAAPALERVIASLSADRQMRVMHCLAETDEAWTVRALVSSVRNGKHYLAMDALDAAERLTGQVFFPKGRRSVPPPNPPIKDCVVGRAVDAAEVKEGRKNFLAWWNREGKAKYGRSE
jgi:hypothetical protein